MHPEAMHAGVGNGALLGLLVVLPMVVLTLYLAGAARTRRSGGWSTWRLVSFATGIALLMIAGSPLIAGWAHHDLRGHMVQHLLLGMFAPLALVLGAPGTLLLREIPAAVARRIVAVLDTPAVRGLIHPLTAALLDIGGMYLLYLTPLYAWTLTDPALHGLLHVHFVVAGYLFTWSIAGPDPAPHRPGFGIRLAVLFLATAAHANLGKIMYGYAYPRGTSADLAEIRSAAQWMYYGGDLAELLLIVAFFAMWFGRRHRMQRTADRIDALAQVG